MKIGILTFIHTHNFGANLQCFALQHTLETMGYETEVINLYRPVDKGYVPCGNDKIQFAGIYRYHSLKDYRSKFNKIIAPLVNRFLRKHKNDKEKPDGFLSFQKQFIHFSREEYHNFTQLYKNFPQDKYTHLIAGSDQIWNYASGFSKEPFFLTFAKKPNRIAYAASLGHSNIPPKVAKLYKNWLDGFLSISVREEDASALFSSLLNKEVPQVLDPTLLLNKKTWMEAFSINQEITENYVLVYMLSISSAALTISQEIAAKLGCTVKIITSRPVFTNPNKTEILRSEDPKSFIEKYCMAKFVVTNSFHGTAFAINFNIPFITVERSKSRLNSRKTSILKLLQLKHRNITEDNNIDVNNYLTCDFDLANKLLEEEREKSLNFLKESLNNA